MKKINVVQPIKVKSGVSVIVPSPTNYAKIQLMGFIWHLDLLFNHKRMIKTPKSGELPHSFSLDPSDDTK